MVAFAKVALVLLTVLCAGMFAFARSKPEIDPRLKGVRSIFVAGNNQAAEKAREEMRKGNACFSLVSNPKDADGVLEMGTDTARDNAVLGTREWIVSATLTLKSGDLIWSHSERFSDAPFMSGGKTAGKLLYLDLKREACGK